MHPYGSLLGGSDGGVPSPTALASLRGGNDGGVPSLGSLVASLAVAVAELAVAAEGLRKGEREGLCLRRHSQSCKPRKTGQLRARCAGVEGCECVTREKGKAGALDCAMGRFLQGGDKACDRRARPETGKPDAPYSFDQQSSADVASALPMPKRP